MKNISIISFTEDGAKQSERVVSYLHTLKENWIIQQYEKTSHPFLAHTEKVESSLADWCIQTFPKSDVILFIGAIGIAVRGIASCVEDKFKDPAVLVMDEMGHHVIPVLSGHVGGANEFALELSEGLGADPVITTATDLHQLFAVDVFAKKNDLVIADRRQAKEISASLLREEKVYFYAADKRIQNVDNQSIKNVCLCTKDHFIERMASISAKGVVVTDQMVDIDGVCQLIPKCNILGIGCRKGTDSDLLEQTILHILSEHRILLQSVARIATINIKKDEAAICAFSEKYQIPVDIFTAEELMAVKGEFSASDFVFSQTGTDNVCERAAVASALQSVKKVELTIKKQAGNGITLALATRDWSITFE